MRKVDTKLFPSPVQTGPLCRGAAGPMGGVYSSEAPLAATLNSCLLKCSLPSTHCVCVCVLWCGVVVVVVVVVVCVCVCVCVGVRVNCVCMPCVCVC